MRKVLKNFVSMVLVLGMILSLASLPAMADGTYTKNEKFKIGFDSLTADATIGGKPNQFVNGGKEDSMYAGFYMVDEISAADNAFYLYDGDKYNAGASSKIISRATSDNALEVTVKSSAAVSPYIDYGQELAIAPTDENSVIHLGVDLMRYDISCEWSLRINTNTSGWQYDMLSFSAAGKISFFGSEVSSYDLNKWYNIDIYFDVDTNNWYLYIGGQQVKTVNKTVDFTSLVRIRSTWASPSGLETKLALDNFRINEYSYEETVVPDPEPVQKEAVYVKAGFDSLIADAAIGGKPNQIVNGGKEASLWQGFYFENEITKEYTGLYMNDGANYNAGASSKIISRADNNNAMEITVSSSASVTPQINIGQDMNIALQKENAIMHFGIDVYRYDVSCDWDLWLNAQPNGWNYDILEFTSGNKIKFLGKEVCSYNINTWYDVDIYYSTITGKWYLYLDGELVKTAAKNIALTTITTFRATWSSPSGQETKLAVDNISIGEFTAQEIFEDVVLKQNDIVISDGKFTTGAITAECNIILSNTNTPALIIAQYVDDTLVALGTGTYVNGKATASLDVKSATGTIKVMLLDDIETINPLKRSIELAAK